MPLLLLAGNADEAFVASEYEPLFRSHTKSGTYHVLPGVGRLDIVDSCAAKTVLLRWL